MKSTTAYRGSFYHLSIQICLVVITLSGLIQAQRVDTDPPFVELVEGERTSLLCRSGRPLTYCRIEIPGEKVLILSQEWDKTPGFSYNGAGLQTGQCGVTIERVSAKNHGKVKCFLGAEGEEIQGSIDLVVALAPLRPELDILTPSQTGSYEVDQIMRVKCIARDGRPAANLSWSLDGEPLPDNELVMKEIVESLDARNTTLYTSTQEVQRYLQAYDDGKSLICRSTHLADRGEVNEVKLQLSVKYKPQSQPDIKVYGLSLDSKATINVTILSNPRPRTIWIVEGTNIQEGEAIGRYEAHMPIDLGHGEYNVSLTIFGLTLEDTQKVYHLRAVNDFGNQDYNIRISDLSAPTSTGLGVGAIVGIIAVIAIIVLVVLLLIFARATSRWCFRGKSINSPTSETSDTESAEVKATKTRKLPSFQAIFKKNEKIKLSKNPTVENGNEQNDEKPPIGDSQDVGQNVKDDVPKEEKQLVYAELVLKPSEKPNKPQENSPTPQKNSTEYAEIVYVQKPNQEAGQTKLDDKK